MEIVYSRGISFVCPSLLSRSSHKLEFDAPHDAVESLEPTTTVSPGGIITKCNSTNIGKSQATGISYIITRNNSKN